MVRRINKGRIKELSSLISKYDSSILYYILTQSIISGAAYFFSTYMVALIVDKLFDKVPSRDIVKTVLFMVIIDALFAIIMMILNRIINKKQFYLKHKYQQSKTQAVFNIAYEDVETSQFEDLRNQVRFSDDNMGTFNALIGNFTSLFDSIIMSVFAIAALCVLIAQVIISGDSKLVFLLPPFILVIVITTITLKITRIVQRKVQYKLPSLYDEMTTGNRLAMYIANRVVYNYGMGKDIRIYDSADMINEELTDMHGRMRRNFKQVALITGLPHATSAVSTGIVSGVVYALVAIMAYLKYISLGNVLFYVNTVQRLISNVTSLSFTIGEFAVLESRLSHSMKLLSMPIVEQDYSDSDVSAQIADNAPLIEFRHVSFQYSESDKLILDDISLTIMAGEKIAIVGKNGAGKTTAIKLLCKLYKPDSGKIYVRGRDIWTIPDSEYREIVSAIFQDFKLFSFSIGENLALADEYDSERAEQALLQSGFSNRLGTLDKGLDTVLYHDYDANAIECSGGEAQKIAIARCLYSNSPIMILDEPSSALDAISEAEIYENFNKYSLDKTAIYISHRLSACRFCDRILVIDDGRIVQEGAHEHLLEQKDSLYSEMWQAQSKLYL